MLIELRSALIVKTATEWAADTETYPEYKLLVTSDFFYVGTDQPRFKIANGIDIWSDLDYVPAGGADTNMANDNLIQDDNRLHDASGYSWALTDLHQLKFESTSTSSGQPAFGYEFNPGGSSYSDMVFRVMIDGNTSRPPLEIRGDRSVGIGDNAQSNIQLQVYTNSKNKTIAAGNDASGGKSIDAVANGANGFGAQLTGQGAGGTGAKILGDAAGMMGQVVSDSGTAVIAQGGLIVKNFDDNSARQDSALGQFKSTTKAALLLNPITKAQRDSISPTQGMIIAMNEFDATELEGLYYYHSIEGWVRLLMDI